MLNFITDLFKPKASKPAPITSETSMNFDAGDVRPFLIGLMNNPRFGLPAELPDFVAKALVEMAVDQTQRFKIDGDFDGAPVEIEIEIFMDDIDAPDIAFFSSQPVVTELERELNAFAELMES